MGIQLATATPRPRSDAEQQVRADLAAAYRLVAHYGMDDSIYTHKRACPARTTAS